MISISENFYVSTKEFYLEHFKITYLEVYYHSYYKGREESIKIEPYEIYRDKKKKTEALIKHKEDFIGFYDYIERKKYSNFKTKLILTLYSRFLLDELYWRREGLEYSLIIEYLSRGHKQYFPTRREQFFYDFISEMMENKESLEHQKAKKILEILGPIAFYNFSNVYNLDSKNTELFAKIYSILLDIPTEFLLNCFINFSVLTNLKPLNVFLDGKYKYIDIEEAIENYKNNLFEYIDVFVEEPIDLQFYINEAVTHPTFERVSFDDFPDDLSRNTKNFVIAFGKMLQFLCKNEQLELVNKRTDLKHYIGRLLAKNLPKQKPNLLSKNFKSLEKKRQVKIKAILLEETRTKVQLRYYDFRYKSFKRWLWVPKYAIIKREQPTKLEFKDGAAKKVPERFSYFWIGEDQLIKQKIDYQYMEDLKDDEVQKVYPFEED